jgi:type VI protein secretion system component VasK
MKLIPEAWTVLKHAWSVRFIVLALAVVWLEGPLTTLIAYFAGEGLLSQLASQAIISTVMVAAIYARVVAQDRMQERVTVAKVSRQVRARYGNQ